MHPESLVVVSFYNARDASPLAALLEQIAAIDAGAPFDLLVVVNQEIPQELDWSGMPTNWKVVYRENLGYNIGAWQHGWLSARAYKYYLFLQDECQIQKPNWLRAFIRKAAAHDVIGESLVIVPAIRKWRAALPEFIHAAPIILARSGRTAIRDWTHVQSTIVFATAGALERTAGFVVPGNDKLEAMACEVAFSFLARDRGFAVAQLEFLPFEYISHPQWASLRANMRGPVGRLRRLLNLLRWALKLRAEQLAGALWAALPKRMGT